MTLISQLNDLVGKHGVGRLDMNRKPGSGN
ncbi:MAG UNVERIFIED_CONTAM: hypothetical protein LVR29_01185 [Microcystis novacekii LVE1205-3]